MKTVFRWLGSFLLFVLLLTLPLLVQAEKSLESVEISQTKIREKIKTIKNKPNVDEELRLTILSAYYAAEDNFDELIILDQQIQNERIQLKKLPREIQQLEKKIKKTERNLKNIKIEKLSIVPIDELEQRLVFERSNLNLLMSSVSQLEIQRAEHLKRPQQIREQMAEVRNEQIKSKHQQSLVSTQVSNQQELLARQTQLDSRLRKLNAMLTQLDLENIAYPLRDQAQTLSLQLLNLQSEPITTLVNTLDSFLTNQRQQEISDEQAELIQFQKDLAGKHFLIKEVATENIKYKQLLLDTNTKLEKYIDQKSEIEAHYKQLEKDYQSAEQKINLAGLSPALGNLLREQRRNLPLAKKYQNKFDYIQKEIALAGLEIFQIEEVKKSLSDIDHALLIRMSAYITKSNDLAEKSKHQIELRNLLINQKKLLSELGSVYLVFSRTLADVDFSLHQLVTLGAKFNHYLNQRLLWVPSAPVIDQNYLLEIFDSVVWLVHVSGWQQAVEDIIISVQIHPFLAFLSLILICSLILFRKQIKLNLQLLLTNSSSLYADHFNFTYYSLSYVFLLALPIPLIVFCSGWLLRINEMSTSFSLSVAQGLIAASIPLLTIQFFYYLFKPKGVVQSLFGWKEHKTQLLYGLLKWLRFVVVPAIFMIAMFADDTYSVQSYSLGRMALIISMLAIAYLIHCLAHPVNGLGKEFYQQNPASWAYRLRFVCYGFLLLLPFVIIGFAIAGYYQSALELQYKLVIVLRLIFFTTLFHEIVIRWMFLENRQLALQNARQKRKLQEQADTMDKSDVITNQFDDEVLLDIPKINEQSKTLLQAVVSVILLVGVWLTVKDILPAFSIFDQVVLWQHISLSDGKEVLQSITLINIFFCLLYLLLMFVFVNNFPGLIDLLFAGRYSMAAGSRYALIQLTRYAVIAITLIVMTNELGGSWSQVQWLVAAVSVGLGFGLQEIFANMVSGIILLFERPIRVGDTVTVGDVTGKVCRIQMRATTIIDWDQKELIVPNKTFITDKLINWSLTDTVTRVVISVGIAYDSDEELAIRLFKQVIEESPLVLKDPEPSVYFLSFGDSSLDFELRVFVSDLGDRFPVTDDLHRRIRQVLKAHNIEIPFPQRDLHIHSTAL